MSDYAGRMNPAPRTTTAAGRAVPGSTENPPLEPVLFPDIDPILLAKVHGGPDVTSLADMQAAAIAQGTETAALGAANEASQQEPPLGTPDAP